MGKETRIAHQTAIEASSVAIEKKIAALPIQERVTFSHAILRKEREAIKTVNPQLASEREKHLKGLYESLSEPSNRRADISWYTKVLGHVLSLTDEHFLFPDISIDGHITKNFLEAWANKELTKMATKKERDLYMRDKGKGNTKNIRALGLRTLNAFLPKISYDMKYRKEPKVIFDRILKELESLKSFR